MTETIVHLPGLWELLSSQEWMMTALQIAKDKVKEGQTKKSKYLIGEETDDEAETQSDIIVATHPSNISDQPKSVETPLLSLFDIVDTNNIEELHWATITLLAIDEDVREMVARQTSPAAAAYLRNLDTTYTRWIMGTETYGITTAFEATLEFINAVEILHKFVKRT